MCVIPIITVNYTADGRPWRAHLGLRLLVTWRICKHCAFWGVSESITIQHLSILIPMNSYWPLDPVIEEVGRFHDGFIGTINRQEARLAVFARCAPSWAVTPRCPGLFKPSIFSSDNVYRVAASQTFSHTPGTSTRAGHHQRHNEQVSTVVHH